MENELISTEKLEQLIDEKKTKDIRQLFEVVPTIDIAEACDDIEDKKKLVFIFKYVKAEYTADLFTELSVDTKEELINIMSNDQLAEILEGQFTDDLVDDLEDMPANIVTRVLRNVPKDRRATINKLLNYKENTAGSIMTTEFLTLLDTLTADEAIAQIRKFGKTKETIYTLFIIDKQRNLVGTLDLDDLIFAKGEEKVSDLMNRDFVTCMIHEDQEEVANLIKRYDLNAIAVLNNDKRLIGLVTVDDIVDVIEQEAEEDIAALSNVSALEESFMATSPIKMFGKCAPWIIILIVLGTFSSFVLSKFDNAIAIIPALAAFIPIVMDAGGNAGGQTIALMIRGLANHEFEPKDIWKVLGKGILSSILIALVCGGAAFIWFTIIQYSGIVSLGTIDGHNFEGLMIWNGSAFNGDIAIPFLLTVLKVSAVVGITLFADILISKTIAIVLPLTVAALKKDPAIIAQPLLTTIVDVVSLLIFFGTALLLFQGILHI